MRIKASTSEPRRHSITGSAEASGSWTQTLLTCGVVAGPLFFGTVIVQAVNREGFDPRIHPLSLLGLGDLGWVQIANFLLVGLLVSASAVGIRRALRGQHAGTWGPLLIGVYGVALIWAGLFPADPADGFPIGTPNSSVGQPSWHGLLHLAAPTVMGIALDAACVVFARRFFKLGEPGWAVYCLVTIAGDFSAGIAAALTQDFRLLLLGGALTWGWASVIAGRLLIERNQARAWSNRHA
jgi:hypothetical protein